MIPKTNSRPPGPSPLCRNCNRPLRSYWALNWPATNRAAIDQTWSGYGRLGNGFFCSLRCGYYWAIEQVKREQRRP